MNKLANYFKRPFEEKGVIVATFDFMLRGLTVFVWMYLMTILIRLVWDSLLLDYNPMAKMWWFSYSFLIFFGASWLAYIVLFVRNYYMEEE